MLRGSAVRNVVPERRVPVASAGGFVPAFGGDSVVLCHYHGAVSGADGGGFCYTFALGGGLATENPTHIFCTYIGDGLSDPSYIANGHIFGLSNVAKSGVCCCVCGTWTLF